MLKNSFVYLLLILLVMSCGKQEKCSNYYNELSIKYDKFFYSSSGLIRPCSSNFGTDTTFIKDTVIINPEIIQLINKSLSFSRLVVDTEYVFNLSIKVYLKNKTNSDAVCISRDGKIVYNNKLYENKTFCFLIRLYSGFYCYVHPAAYKYLPEYPLIKLFMHWGLKIKDKSQLFEIIEEGVDKDSVPYVIMMPL